MKTRMKVGIVGMMIMMLMNGCIDREDAEPRAEEVLTTSDPANPKPDRDL